MPETRVTATWLSTSATRTTPRDLRWASTENTETAPDRERIAERIDPRPTCRPRRDRPRRSNTKTDSPEINRELPEANRPLRTVSPTEMENLRHPEQLIRPDFLVREKCRRWDFRSTRMADHHRNSFGVSLLALQS